jgi:hypothetical protein
MMMEKVNIDDAGQKFSRNEYNGLTDEFRLLSIEVDIDIHAVLTVVIADA